MPPTLISGLRTTDGVSSSLIKREVYEAIFNFKPYQTPVTQYFLGNKAAKYASGNVKIELQEDVLVPHTFTPAAGLTGGFTSENGWDVGASYIKLFQVGTVIHCTDTQESYRVDNLPGGTSIDVTKIGSGNITATLTTYTYLILGANFGEGTTSATAVSTQGTFPYNYLEIKKKSVYMSGTQLATVNYGGSDWTQQRMKATEEFKLDLERTWMYGVRDVLTTAGAYQWFTGGLLDSSSIGITDRSQFAGSGFATEDFFFGTFLKGLFQKGTNMKTLYCGADALMGINNYQKVKQQTKTVEREFGVDLQTIISPFGGCQLVWHPLLEGYYSNWVVAVDRDNFMKYAYMSGNGYNRDMQYQTDLETPDRDAKLAQYLAQVGLHFAGGSQGVHRVLYPGA